MSLQPCRVTPGKIHDDGYCNCDAPAAPERETIADKFSKPRAEAAGAPPSPPATQQPCINGQRHSWWSAGQLGFSCRICRVESSVRYQAPPSSPGEAETSPPKVYTGDSRRSRCCDAPVVDDGECCDSCCDFVRCSKCNRRIRIEVPQ